MSRPVLRTKLCDELGIEYIYIGPLERTQYPHTLDKFEELVLSKYLSIAYQNDLVTIYQAN